MFNHIKTLELRQMYITLIFSMSKNNYFFGEADFHT